jgi:flagellin
MGLRIQNNVEAFNTHRQLTATGVAASKSMEKLSSGYRINRAADDAAGLAISEKMRGQIGGLAQAQRNAQDGISLVQTAEGALTEVHSMLQRVRDLKVQFSNGTLSNDDKDAIASEVLALGTEIHSIIGQTKFNNTSLLGAGTINFQVGANDGETISVTAAASLVGAAGTDANNDGVYTAGQEATGVYDVLNAVFGTPATGPGTERTTAQIRDRLSGVDSNSDGDYGDGGAEVAPLTLAMIDNAIKNVSTRRADLGAVQNRLEHRLANLATYQENLTASESRIRDVDMAAEMTKFTKLNILQQAGTSMLAQANQAPQGVLSLLR